MRRFWAAILALVMLWSLTACAQPSGSAAQQEGGETQTVTDALGRDVEVPTQVERVVAIGNAQRLLVYLGLSEKIVGATKVTASEIPEITPVTPFAYVNRELWADLPKVGDGNGDALYPEEILALQPDVIVCASISEDAVINLASQTGIPVVYVRADVLFSEDYSDALLILGQTCGAQERAQEVVQYLEDALQDLNDRTQSASEQADAVTTLSAGATFKGAHGIEGVRLQDPVLEAVHAHNVAAELYQGAASAEVDREQILVWDPDVIFCDYSGVQLIKEDYKANAAYYQQLTAWREGRMYQHPNGTSYYANLELSLANAYYIGSVLYPQAFADLNVEERINEILHFFVGAEDYTAVLQEAGAGYGAIEFGE